MPKKSDDSSDALVTALITTRERVDTFKRSGSANKKRHVFGKLGCRSSNLTAAENFAAINKHKKFRACLADALMEDPEGEETLIETDALAAQLDGILASIEVEEKGGHGEAEQKDHFTSASDMLTADLQDTRSPFAVSRKTTNPKPGRYERREGFGVAIIASCANFIQKPRLVQIHAQKEKNFNR